MYWIYTAYQGVFVLYMSWELNTYYPNQLHNNIYILQIEFANSASNNLQTYNENLEL